MASAGPGRLVVCFSSVLCEPRFVARHVTGEERTQTVEPAEGWEECAGATGAVGRRQDARCGGRVLLWERS